MSEIYVVMAYAIGLGLLAIYCATIWWGIKKYVTQK